MNKQELMLVKELAKLAKRGHDSCDDPWYSCPKSDEGCGNTGQGDECTCGADAHNVKVEEIISKLFPSCGEETK